MDALEKLSTIMKNLDAGGPAVIEVEMAPETFVDFSIAQMAKAAKEPREQAMKRLSLLQKNRDRIAKEYSFEGSSPVPMKVEVYADDVTQKPTDEEKQISSVKQPQDSIWAVNAGDADTVQQPKPGPKGDFDVFTDQPGTTSFAAGGGKDGSFEVSKAETPEQIEKAFDEHAWPEDLNDLGGKKEIDWGNDPKAIRGR